jgi:hypothetical protein
MVRRYGFVDRPEKVPDPGLAEEVKLTLEVFGQGVVVGERLQVAPKASTSAVEIEHRASVGDCGFNLAAVTNHSRVVGEVVDITG